MVCLDSGAGNYDQLWMTTSLRGMVSGTLEVQVLDEGVHSGDSSGVVPSSFRILRHLLDRLEDSSTGRLLPQSLHCEIPAERVEQVHATARILGDEVWRRFPWSCGADGGFVLPMTTEPEQALLNRTWRPTLSVTGAEGLPPLSSAGNVLRPRTAFKLSLPAAAGRRRGRLAGDQGAAGSRRAVQRQGHLQGQRRRRHRLERAGLGALADRRWTPPRRPTTVRPAATLARAAPSR